jgi:hypothetical protein
MHALSSGIVWNSHAKEYFLLQLHNASARDALVKFRQSAQFECLRACENFYR